MIRLTLAAGKYPAGIKAAIETFDKRLHRLSKALSILPWRLPAAQIKRIPKSVQIDIQIITDRTMLKMNTQYRNKDTTTDVLSFSYLESGLPVFAHEPVGEICISQNKAATQARENGLTLTDELCVLAVHGALHVMGYDHERSEREETAMHRAELSVLTAAGIHSGLTGRHLQATDGSAVTTGGSALTTNSRKIPARAAKG